MITAVENIPVFSYLFLRGRCRGCKEPIPLRYPLIELATGILFGLTAWKFGLTFEAAIFAAFFWVLVVLSVIDQETGLLPDRIVYPSFVVGWVGLVAATLINDETDRIVRMGVGALIFGGFFLVVDVLYMLIRGKQGIGGGDIKLAFVLGTFLGYLDAPELVLAGMFLSFAAGSILGIGIMMFTPKGKDAKVRFGPFLALGTAIAVFAGERLVDGYVNTLT
jgi:leader peptidase (prepilin peptidase)/N-methyltransferase